MDEGWMRLVQAQERAQRFAKLDYWAQAADYLMEKGCFVGASLLIDWICWEAEKVAD